MGTISINGEKVGSGRLEKTIPFIYGTETADVGMDLYSAVSHDYAKGDNDFNGKIKKLTVSVK
jgi:arylsulfatase